MTENSIVIFEDIFDPRIVNKFNGNCVCGYPEATCMEILTKKRDFICPKCGRDNTPRGCWDD